MLSAIKPTRPRFQSRDEENQWRIEREIRNPALKRAIFECARTGEFPDDLLSMCNGEGISVSEFHKLVDRIANRVEGWRLSQQLPEMQAESDNANAEFQSRDWSEVHKNGTHEEVLEFYRAQADANAPHARQCDATHRIAKLLKDTGSAVLEMRWRALWNQRHGLREQIQVSRQMEADLNEEKSKLAQLMCELAELKDGNLPDRITTERHARQHGDTDDLEGVLRQAKVEVFEAIDDTQKRIASMEASIDTSGHPERITELSKEIAEIEKQQAHPYHGCCWCPK